MAWPHTPEEPTGTYQDGWKPTKDEAPEFRCRVCGSDGVWYRTWESSDGAYIDYRYECRSCKRTWWVEGADS
jgi:hypothetical protein